MMFRGWLFVSLLAAAVVAGCGGNERPKALDPNEAVADDDENRDPDDGDDDSDDDFPSTGDDPPPTDLDAGLLDAGSLLDAGADAGPRNCGQLVCRGHGQCVEEGNTPVCVCDEGYERVEQDGEFECVVDKTCRRLRSLEGSCRNLINSAPAVAMFFAVDYCAGTAVLPEDLGDLDEAFKILENGVDIEKNQESAATVVERDVESFVTIALDVSKSIVDVQADDEKKEQLQALVAQLRTFVQSLKAPADEPPVSVSVMVFGRFVAEYVPYTTNLADVDRALQRIEANPAEVGALVRGDGTALHPAVEQGIHAVERIQSLRKLVSHGGVLTTGTLVVVTDGRDTSNAELDLNQIEDTLVNVISVGISNEIDDEDLTKIGRDGSFLAPRPEDWEAAFTEIAERVDQYPDRAYLLAYCSSATTGTAKVSVSLSGDEPDTIATCEFDADVFSRNPDDVCDLSLFDSACNSVQCGGFLACGACAPDQCCSQGTCQAPGKVEGDCRGQDQLCKPAGEVCEEDPELNEDRCTTPLSVGEVCDDSNDACQPTAAYCPEVELGDPVCQAVSLQNGDRCGDSKTHSGRACPELNCAQKNPNNANDPYVCQPEARVFDRCSGTPADAECESGAFCDGSTCAARHLLGCDSDDECASGHCDTNANWCIDDGACFFDWNSKMGF